MLVEPESDLWQARHAMLSAVLVLVLLPLAWLVAALMLDRYGRASKVDGEFDAIVVPGCRVSPDGSPSGHLARRVERSVELWGEGKAPTVVFTGGGEPAEAAVAARCARRLGLPESAIALENRSRTTEQNASFTAVQLEARRILVVTDSYHVWRARQTFRRYFETVAAVGVTAPRTARLENGLREVLAIGWHVLRSGLRLLRPRKE